MPYTNVPESMWEKMDKCVEDVQKQGHDKPSAVAICHESIVKGKELLRAIKEYTVKETGPASDYLVVEDAEQPSTYHLRVKMNGKVDHTLMGAAWAALHGGYRGNVYEGPGKQEAIAKLKRLYESEGMAVPSEKETSQADDIILPDGVTMDEMLRIARAILDAPDETTGKASTSQGSSGGTPRGSVSVNIRGGVTGGHDSQQEKCFIHMKKLVGSEAAARKICHDAANRMGAKESSFTVTKQADGKYRWLIVSSSSFMDRDREIVSQAALEADTARMNTTKEYGILDWWHTPVRLGACDFSAMHGRLSVESGTFDDNLIGEKLAEHSGDLAASRSFKHSIVEPDASGVYHNIHTFARAILPRGKESNILTNVSVTKESQQMLADKIKELVARLGGDKAAEEKVNALLVQASEVEKAADAAGIAHKETTPAPVADLAPEPDKPAWFLADMKPDEFGALIGKAMKEALDPVLAEIKVLKEAQAVAVKEAVNASGANIVAEIGKVATKQAAIEAQVNALNGLTPKAFRASQAQETITEKKVQVPADDIPYISRFVNNFVTGTPAAPKP